MPLLFQIEAARLNWKYFGTDSRLRGNDEQKQIASPDPGLKNHCGGEASSFASRKPS